MTLDEVLGVAVGFDIKERLENIYGITDIETIDRVFDCVADSIVDLFITGSGEKDMATLIGDNSIQERLDELNTTYDELTDEIKMLAKDVETLTKSEIKEELERIHYEYAQIREG